MTKYIIEFEKWKMVWFNMWDKPLGEFDKIAPKDFDPSKHHCFLDKNWEIQLQNLEEHSKEIVKEFEKEDKKFDLNKERNKELNNLVINNIKITEEILAKMSSKYQTTSFFWKVNWIDVDNNQIQMTKTQFWNLIKKWNDEIEKIYFKYRNLKDNL